MAKLSTHPWFYRTIALVVFLAAQLLVLAIPQKMQEPGDWGFQYAARNFAQGHVVLTDEQYIEQSWGAWFAGGQLLSYANVGEHSWAFTWAPGYAFYLVPFERIGAPWLGASLLSFGLAAVLYLLLARIKDEKTALLGVVLLVFSPLYLAMWQRVYMDSLAALAFCGIGGGLYLYYWLSRARLRASVCAVILLVAGFMIMASVGVRYTNIAVAAVFGVHFIVMAVRSHLRREHFLPIGLLFGLGAALSGVGILIYRGVAFGTPFNSGGEFAQLPVKFAWHYTLGSGFSIVRNNIIQLWAPLITAMPVLFVAVPAFAAVGYGKGFFPRRRDTWLELPAHTFHLLWGWVAAVFGVYVMYEWTSYQAGGQLLFPLLARFYLPALFPLVVISALMLRRLSVRFWGSILTVLTVLGIIFYLQVARVQIQFANGVIPPSLRAPAAFESPPVMLPEELVL